MNLYGKLNSLLGAILERLGLILMKRTNPRYYLGTRAKIIKLANLDLVLDVGANTGQYALEMRKLGYKGKMISFEPMTKEFSRLKGLSDLDNNWEVYNFALGSEVSEQKINITENSISSSLLDPTSLQFQHSKNSKIIKTEKIKVECLDSFFQEDSLDRFKRIWLKMDVQGFEDKVLIGAGKCLKSISYIQLELSFSELYKDSKTILPMLELLEQLGFQLIAFEPGFTNQNIGGFLQVDGILIRRDLLDEK